MTGDYYMDGYDLACAYANEEDALSALRAQGYSQSDIQAFMEYRYTLDGFYEGDVEDVY
jgi:hypothetical protein